MLSHGIAWNIPLVIYFHLKACAYDIQWHYILLGSVHTDIYPKFQWGCTYVQNVHKRKEER